MMPCANLLGSLALLVHGIRVVELFQTNGALRTVCIFEAAVQTVMPHTVAVAVARLLVQDRGNLGRQLIGMGLERSTERWVPTTGPGRGWEAISSLCRRPGVKCRYLLACCDVAQGTERIKRSKNKARMLNPLFSIDQDELLELL